MTCKESDDIQFILPRFEDTKLREYWQHIKHLKHRRNMLIASLRMWYNYFLKDLELFPISEYYQDPVKFIMNTDIDDVRETVTPSRIFRHLSNSIIAGNKFVRKNKLRILYGYGDKLIELQDYTKSIVDEIIRTKGYTNNIPRKIKRRSKTTYHRIDDFALKYFMTNFNLSKWEPLSWCGALLKLQYSLGVKIPIRGKADALDKLEPIYNEILEIQNEINNIAQKRSKLYKYRQDTKYTLQIKMNRRKIITAVKEWMNNDMIPENGIFNQWQREYVDELLKDDYMNPKEMYRERTYDKNHLLNIKPLTV